MSGADDHDDGDPRGHRPAAWPPILIPEDLAALLGLQSGRAARRFVEREGVPHVRAGRRLLVLLDSLLEFLRRREQTGDRGDSLVAAANKLRSQGRAGRQAVIERLAKR